MIYNMAVMRGLDPRMHLHSALTQKMDGRVKPGHDDLIDVIMEQT